MLNTVQKLCDNFSDNWCQRLAMSRAVPAGSRDVSVAFTFTCERTTEHGAPIRITRIHMAYDQNHDQWLVLLNTITNLRLLGEKFIEWATVSFSKSTLLLWAICCIEFCSSIFTAIKIRYSAYWERWVIAFLPPPLLSNVLSLPSNINIDTKT